MPSPHGTGHKANPVALISIPRKPGAFLFSTTPSAHANASPSAHTEAPGAGPAARKFGVRIQNLEINCVFEQRETALLVQHRAMQEAMRSGWQSSHLSGKQHPAPDRSSCPSCQASRTDRCYGERNAGVRQSAPVPWQGVGRPHAET